MGEIPQHFLCCTCPMPLGLLASLCRCKIFNPHLVPAFGIVRCWYSVDFIHIILIGIFLLSPELQMGMTFSTDGI